MIQLAGTHGPVYVRADAIIALEGLCTNPYSNDATEQVRDLHVSGAPSTISILDTPDNIDAVMRALETQRGQTI